VTVQVSKVSTFVPAGSEVTEDWADETVPEEDVTAPDESDPVDVTEPDWALETDAPDESDTSDYVPGMTRPSGRASSPQAEKEIASTAIVKKRILRFMRSPWRVVSNPTTICMKNPAFCILWRASFSQKST